MTPKVRSDTTLFHDISHSMYYILKVLIVKTKSGDIKWHETPDSRLIKPCDKDENKIHKFSCTVGDYQVKLWLGKDHRYWDQSNNRVYSTSKCKLVIIQPDQEEIEYGFGKFPKFSDHENQEPDYSASLLIQTILETENGAIDLLAKMNTFEEKLNKPEA